PAGRDCCRKSYRQRGFRDTGISSEDIDLTAGHAIGPQPSDRLGPHVDEASRFIANTVANLTASLALGYSFARSKSCLHLVVAIVERGAAFSFSPLPNINSPLP